MQILFIVQLNQLLNISHPGVFATVVYMSEAPVVML